MSRAPSHPSRVAPAFLRRNRPDPIPPMRRSPTVAISRMPKARAGGSGKGFKPLGTPGSVPENSAKTAQIPEQAFHPFSPRGTKHTMVTMDLTADGGDPFCISVEESSGFGREGWACFWQCTSC